MGGVKGKGNFDIAGCYTVKFRKYARPYTSSFEYKPPRNRNRTVSMQLHEEKETLTLFFSFSILL